MSDNALLKHVFSSGVDFDPDKEFGLSRQTRSQRLHEIIRIVRKHKIMQGITPDQFRALLEDLGPSFVKIGQMLSTRSEILPQAYCDELSHLQTQSSPMSFDEVNDALRHIYGSRFDEIFEYIDPKPLGSASLAQVHKAKLKSGEIVAVKVQRPHVRVTMARDIDVMRSLLRRFSRLMKDNQMLDLQAVVEEMWITFLEETNFKTEAANLTEFALRNKEVVFINCPKPFLDYCAEEVLVMEYIEGISIRDTKRLLAYGYDLQEIGDKILDNYATQILDHGFFHADPHPGNIVIKDGQIVYLDLGIMGRLSPRDRSGLGDIIEAVGRNNAAMLKDALFSFSEKVDLNKVDHARFLSELDNILNRYATLDVSQIDIPAFLNEVMALMRDSHVELPSSVSSVGRGIVTIEGTLTEYVGDFNIAGIINRHLQNKKDPAETLVHGLEDAVVAMTNALQGLTEAAKYSGDVMKQLSRGQLRVNMEMLGSQEPFQKMGRLVNRLTVGLLIAGLMVASALISPSEGMPELLGLPFLSTIGYIVAFFMMVGLAIDIYRKSHK